MTTAACPDAAHGVRTTGTTGTTARAGSTAAR